MLLQPDSIRDKVEFFEADSLNVLEKKIMEKIDMNQALMLEVHHVTHNTVFNPVNGKKLYSAAVHFKQT